MGKNFQQDVLPAAFLVWVSFRCLSQARSMNAKVKDTKKQARIERKRETEKRAQMLRRVYAKLKDIEEMVKDIL